MRPKFGHKFRNLGKCSKQIFGKDVCKLFLQQGNWFQEKDNLGTFGCTQMFTEIDHLCIRSCALLVFQSLAFWFLKSPRASRGYLFDVPICHINDTQTIWFFFFWLSVQNQGKFAYLCHRSGNGAPHVWKYPLLGIKLCSLPCHGISGCQGVGLCSAEVGSIHVLLWYQTSTSA